jgi:hypothetical protein
MTKRAASDVPSVRLVLPLFGRSSIVVRLWSFVIRHTTPIKEVT